MKFIAFYKNIKLFIRLMSNTTSYLAVAVAKALTTAIGNKSSNRPIQEVWLTLSSIHYFLSVSFLFPFIVGYIFSILFFVNS